MNVLNRKPTQHIWQTFAKTFSTLELAEETLLDLDCELLSQLPGTQWQSAQSNLGRDHAGLFLGCPLNNDRRQLTSGLLLWCPSGWPAARLEAAVSSRLGNRLFQDENIANALRNFLVSDSSDRWIVNAEGVTLDGPVQRGCSLFNRRQLRLSPFPKHMTPDWIEATLNLSSPNVATIFFDSSVISNDELQFVLSDRVRVIHARSGGRIEKLQERFQHNNLGPAVWNLVDSNHPSNNNQGRIGWLLCGQSSQSEPPSKSNLSTSKTKIVELADHPELSRDGEYLAHWTRGHREPSSDQSPLQHFDSLFFRSGSIVSAETTLNRILVQQKLLAGGKLIRGGRRVVSFTEVPVCEFPERRVFRPHLSRWDFELFGIAIRKSTLRRLGACAVRYVDASQPERPASASKSKQDPALLVHLANHAKVDWSEEREWRVSGDLDLRMVPPEDAFVFVADEQSAKRVAALSRWPVVVLEGVSKHSKTSNNW